MANEVAKRDNNRVTVLLGVGNDSDLDTIQGRFNPTSKRFLVETVEDNAGLPETPAIYNVTMTSKDTEYSQALPAGTRKVDIKLRATNALLKVAFTESASGSTYITVPYGSSLHLENVDLTSITVYVQSPTDVQTLEVLAWT